jgi:hypothetical protein
MSALLIELKSRLNQAQIEIRNFKSLSDSSKNLWLGPIVAVLWAFIALVIGPSEPRESISAIWDLREFFSFVGGYWFLLLVLLSAITVGVLKNTWSRYALSAVLIAHFIFYVSFIPGGLTYDGENFIRVDGRISLFSGSFPAALLFELIPLVGALITARLESAQWIRSRNSQIVSAIRSRVYQSDSNMTQSSDAAANRAWRASRVVELFGWFNVVVGVIGGIILIVLGFNGGNCESSYGDCPTDGTYVGIGFAVMFACVIQGSFFVMIGAFIASRTAPRSTSM